MIVEKFIFENGIKLIYEKREGKLTSFCLGFRAGALEDGDKLGIAHCVEHMVFKAVEGMSESEINTKMDALFGFNNAMTNYPYAVYYGTCESTDFNEAFSLYSNIVFHPLFPEKGFSEEIDVILEELKEWKDDNERLLEDELFYNKFNKIRIKYPIIGTTSSIKDITLDNIKKFHLKYYVPNNCTISVVTSLDLEFIKKIIYENTKDLYKKPIDSFNNFLYEEGNLNSFYKKRRDINGAKILYSFNLGNLSQKEVCALEIFNNYFGVGTSSLLYEAIRTKNGLAYEVSSYLKKEMGIKEYFIYVGTSKDKVEKAVKIIDELLNNLVCHKENFKSIDIKKIKKAMNLKNEIRMERSIELAKELSMGEIMFNDAHNFKAYLNYEFTYEDIYRTFIKILKSKAVEVFLPEWFF